MSYAEDLTRRLKETARASGADLVGIAPAPQGAPQIEVTFDMDANGILSVSAKDKLSGKKQAIKITPSTGLSRQEIEGIMADSKQYAEEDRVNRELTELRNRIKGQMIATARSYTEFGRFLDRAEQEMVKKSIQQARDIPPEEDSISLLKDLLDQLEAGAEKLTAAMFRVPESEGIRSQKMSVEEEFDDSDVQQLLKSALDDVKSG